MAYLQLADKGRSMPRPIEDYYIRVPNGQGGYIMVREDYFDRLPDYQWEQAMDQIAEFDDFGMSGWKERRAERRERRQKRKDEKSSSKATARTQRTAGGGFFNRALDTAKNIFGKGEGAAGEPRTDIEYTPGGGITVDTNPPKYENWYENPWIIGGGLLGAGVLIYFATRK